MMELSDNFVKQPINLSSVLRWLNQGQTNPDPDQDSKASIYFRIL